MRRLALLLSLLLAPATGAAASQWSDCIAGKYHRYAQAQAVWQRGLTELVSMVAPRYADVAKLYMTDQLHAIERARLAVEHLAQREPDKLRTHMPLNNWLSLDEGDRRRIASHNERYAELLRLGEVAMKRTPHPDGDGLRRFMRVEITKLAKYRELLDGFSRSVTQAENIQCK